MNLIELKLQQIELEEAKLQKLKDEAAWRFKPYRWQMKWFAAGIDHKQRALIAANQVGKTQASCVEAVYHLTGRYPEWWAGYRFDHPVNLWSLGVSGAQIKRVLQNKILGKIINKRNDFDGGLIANHLINKDTLVKGAIKDSVQEAYIQHVSGGESKITFLSYEQGQTVLMGDIVDYIMIDEEPKDATIYPQLIMRTINGDYGNGGLVALTFTPENGTTELVYQFQADLKPGQYYLNVTWEDSPHLTTERKEQMLAAIPDYQKDMRSKGIAQLGSGRVYPYPEELIKEKIPNIPDHWPRIASIDFGWNYTALVWHTWDRERDILYLYDAMKIEKTEPSEIALIMLSKGAWIPWSWPADGHMPVRNDGKPQKEMYAEKGINILSEHATDAHGSNSVEAGIQRLRERMRTHRYKISSSLACFWHEYRLYHRKDGKIVKTNDHVLDAARYGEMMLREAITEGDSEGFMLTPTAFY